MSFIPTSHSALDSPLSDGRRVVDAILEPLEDHLTETGLTVVDAGARNGMFMLPPSYTQHAELIGFEPNPSEHEKLMTGSTDAMSFSSMPDFRSTEFHPVALWDEDDVRPLFITQGAGAVTMMGPADRRVTERIYQAYDDDDDPRQGKSFEELHSRVLETEQVACRPLDAVLGSRRIVDFLKIDVEGAELRVLNGAAEALGQARILFIHSEFVTFPYYEEHPLLGDQHLLLHEHGYRLIHIEQGHAGYSRDPTTIPAINDRRLLHAGDITFIIDPDLGQLSAPIRQRMAVTAIAREFNSLGVSLLRDAQLLAPTEIDRIEKALSRVPIKRRVKAWWHGAPERLSQGTHRLRKKS